jgi:hypothetical protein
VTGAREITAKLARQVRASRFAGPLNLINPECGDGWERAPTGMRALGTSFGQRFQAAKDPHPPAAIAA